MKGGGVGFTASAAIADVNVQMWREKLEELGVPFICIDVSLSFSVSPGERIDPWECLERLDKLGICSEAKVSEVEAWIRRMEFQVLGGGR